MSHFIIRYFILDFLNSKNCLKLNILKLFWELYLRDDSSTVYIYNIHIWKLKNKCTNNSKCSIVRSSKDRILEAFLTNSSSSIWISSTDEPGRQLKP